VIRIWKLSALVSFTCNKPVYCISLLAYSLIFRKACEIFGHKTYLIVITTLLKSCHLGHSSVLLCFIIILPRLLNIISFVIKIKTNNLINWKPDTISVRHDHDIIHLLLFGRAISWILYQFKFWVPTWNTYSE